MADLASVKAIVYGRVQRVFFRATTSRHASELGLTGYVRNLRGMEAVEVCAEGERARLEKLISFLNVGPPGAIVERVEIEWSEYTGEYTRFSVTY